MLILCLERGLPDSRTPLWRRCVSAPCAINNALLSSFGAETRGRERCAYRATLGAPASDFARLTVGSLARTISALGRSDRPPGDQRAGPKTSRKMPKEATHCSREHTPRTTLAGLITSRMYVRAVPIRSARRPCPRTRNAVTGLVRVRRHSSNKSSLKICRSILTMTQ
jgi:hypothetical protein